jgi:hypothetical protein
MQLQDHRTNISWAIARNLVCSMYFTVHKTRVLIEEVTRGPGWADTGARTKEAHGRHHKCIGNTCTWALEPIHARKTKKRPTHDATFWASRRTAASHQPEPLRPWSSHDAHRKRKRASPRSLPPLPLPHCRRTAVAIAANVPTSVLKHAGGEHINVRAASPWQYGEHAPCTAKIEQRTALARDGARQVRG